MKFLYYLERAWLVAAAVGFITAIVNLVRLQTFTSPVYFPFLCALMCILLFNNIRGQRRFREAMEKKYEKDKNAGQDKPAE